MAKKLSDYIAEQQQRQQAMLKKLMTESSSGGYRAAPRNDEITTIAKPKKKVDDPRTAPPPYGSWTPEGELLAEEQGLIPPSNEPMGEGHETTPMTLDDEIEADTPNTLKPRTSNDKRLE